MRFSEGGPQEDDRPGTGGRRRAEDVRAAGNSTASAKASTCAGSDTRFSSARSSSARAPNTSRADASGTHLSSFAVVSQDAATSTSSSWRVGLCATAARSISGSSTPRAASAAAAEACTCSAGRGAACRAKGV